MTERPSLHIQPSLAPVPPREPGPVPAFDPPVSAEEQIARLADYSRGAPPGWVVWKGRVAGRDWHARPPGQPDTKRYVHAETREKVIELACRAAAAWSRQDGAQ